MTVEMVGVVLGQEAGEQEGPAPAHRAEGDVREVQPPHALLVLGALGAPPRHQEEQARVAVRGAGAAGLRGRVRGARAGGAGQ